MTTANTRLLCIALLTGTCGATATRPTTQPAHAELVPVEIKLPRPAFISFVGRVAPPPPEGPEMEPQRQGFRPPLLAPRGAKNLALNKPVTSSDKEPVIGRTEQVTDGDKSPEDGSYIELAPGVQWVQIDLGETCAIWGIVVWHHHAVPRVYRDIVVQVSDDPQFVEGVQTVFNNDQDNTCGLGAGKDKHYIESCEGKLIETQGIKARYVRLYSRGSYADEQNHYTEVEVYGLPTK